MTRELFDSEYEYRKALRDRARQQREFAREHGAPKFGFEWYYDDDDIVRQRPIASGRRGKALSREEIEKKAREIKRLEVSPAGHGEFWITLDAAVVIRRMWSDITETFVFEVGTPAHDANGHLDFERVERRIGVGVSFPKARAIAKGVPVDDPDALRGNAIIDPYGTKVREWTDQDYEDEWKSGRVSIGE